LQKGEGRENKRKKKNVATDKRKKFLSGLSKGGGCESSKEGTDSRGELTLIERKKSLEKKGELILRGEVFEKGGGGGKMSH